jgi:probable phosphoglycerate mutase
VSEPAADEPKTYRQWQFTLPPGATDLLLVRHGESAPASEDSPAPMVDGQADPELAPEGHEQAQRLAERLGHDDIAAIYVSSLRRTSQTAAPLTDRLGVTPVVEPDIREIGLGEWEGYAFRKHTLEAHPVALQMFAEQRWDVIPGAEDNEAFRQRLTHAVTRIAAEHVGERIVLVVHGGVIGMLLSIATGAGVFDFLGADNGSISQLVVGPERWLVRRFNDTAHLDPTFTLTAAPLT